MAGNIWVISDTHFYHQNIIEYCNRPFKTAAEMNDYMVTMWNETVKDGDKVYHLGDVYMGHTNGEHERLLSSLKGQKRLVLGNHDNGKDQVLQRVFKKIEVWRMFPEFGLLLTHVPVHPSALQKGNRTGQGKEMLELTNVFGHIHANPAPEGPYRCVCVEQINYKPINIETLRVR
jgi:calcineurin-like phosphoesterase family protein